jgi:acyl transferase domain-containing protein
MSDTENTARLDIAIVGMGLRFPQANNPQELWSRLVDGKSSITAVPPARWMDDERFRTTKFRGGFIDDVACFDAAFFGVSPKEAELMDPQQRILLEVVWQMFENAGIQPSSVAGSNAGVFVGACNNDYGELLNEELAASSLYASTGTSAPFFRIAFLSSSICAVRV